MRFLDTEKEYVGRSNHARPLYTLDTQLGKEFPEFRTAEFTGYKNKKFVKILEENKIPLDGSYWMYRIDTYEKFEGWWIFDDLLKMHFGTNEDIWPCSDSNALWPSGYDPRARESSRWRVARTDQINYIKNLAHIYGAREYITFSQMIEPTPAKKEGEVNE